MLQCQKSNFSGSSVSHTVLCNPVLCKLISRVGPNRINIYTPYIYVPYIYVCINKFSPYPYSYRRAPPAQISTR